MKSEKISPRKKLKAAPAVASLSQVPKSSASSPRAIIEDSRDYPARLSPEGRHLAIELAAFARAEHRGFTEGSPEQDWLEAEIEIDRLLKDVSQRSN